MARVTLQESTNDVDSDNDGASVNSFDSVFGSDTLSFDGRNILKAHEVNFSVLTSSRLVVSQEKIIGQVAMILGKDDIFDDHGTWMAEKGVSPNEASTILRHANWNQDKIYEDYIDTHGTPQLPSTITNSGPRIMSASQLDQQPFTCHICYDENSDATTISAGCNHQFCLTCYQGYLSQKIIHEGSSRPVKCPEFGCDALVDDITLECVVDEMVMNRYRMLQNQAFVSNHDYFRWCPAPDCDYVVECHVPPRSLVYIVPTVQCDCAHVFCFGCGLPDHRPATCGIVKKWSLTSSETPETVNWILKNTRECPYCHVDIEKAGGCDHMTCRNCRRSFCWSCSDLHHGGPCPTHSRQAKNEALRKTVFEREKNVKSFLHHQARFKEYEELAATNPTMYAKIEGKMRLLQQVTDWSWIDVQFLKNALDVIVECRTTLKWSFLFSYYLTESSESALFGYNQKDLENATADLTPLLEAPLETPLKQWRVDLMAKTAFVKRRRDTMLDDAAVGLLDGVWTFDMEDRW